MEFWLEDRGGYLALFAQSLAVKRKRTLAIIQGDGTLYRVPDARSIPGLQYDDRGRIKEVE